MDVVIIIRNNFFNNMENELDTHVIEDVYNLLKDKLQKSCTLKFIYRETGPLGDEIEDNEFGIEVGYKVVLTKEN